VTNVTVTFTGLVTFAGRPEDAFRIIRLSDGQPVTLSAQVSTISGPTGPKTVVTLTFLNQGPVSIINNSLPDGQYQLTVDGDAIRDGSNQAVDADANGTAGGDLIYGDDQAREAFFRRYGDVDGDGRVVNDIIITPLRFPRVSYENDFGALYAALNSRRGDARYVNYLDFDGNGVIDALDLGAYKIDVTNTTVRL
jgi:hypothetical protein